MGILSLEQIEKGEECLSKISALLAKPQKTSKELKQFSRLNGEFYSIIPHRLGIKKSDVQKNLIDSFSVVEEKQNLLQLMKGG